MSDVPYYKSLAFWKAVTYAGAGLLALLVFFKVLPPEAALTPAALLSFALMVLNAFGIYPELLEKGLLPGYKAKK
jgi:hypothetical protein